MARLNVWSISVNPSIQPQKRKVTMGVPCHLDLISANRMAIICVGTYCACECLHSCIPCMAINNSRRMLRIRSALIAHDTPSRGYLPPILGLTGIHSVPFYPPRKGNRTVLRKVGNFPRFGSEWTCSGGLPPRRDCGSRVKDHWRFDIDISGRLCNTGMWFVLSPR